MSSAPNPNPTPEPNPAAPAAPPAAADPPNADQANVELETDEAAPIDEALREDLSTLGMEIPPEVAAQFPDPPEGQHICLTPADGEVPGHGMKPEGSRLLLPAAEANKLAESGHLIIIK